MIAYKLQLKITVMLLITMIIMISGAVSVGWPRHARIGLGGSSSEQKERERVRSGDSEARV